MARATLSRPAMGGYLDSGAAAEGQFNPLTVAKITNKPITDNFTGEVTPLVGGS